MRENIAYAKLVSAADMELFYRSIIDKNNANYEKAYNFLNSKKGKIIEAYHRVDNDFDKIQKNYDIEHKLYNDAYRNKKCICGSDLVYISSHGFYGCRNYSNKSVEHNNFLNQYPPFYKLERWYPKTNGWLATIREIAEIGKKVPTSAILIFLNNLGLDDLAMKYEGIDSWTLVNRISCNKIEATEFEKEVELKLKEKYDRVFPQQAIKYKYVGGSDKFCFLDFLVMTDDELIIYECKTTNAEKDERQRFDYIELLKKAASDKGVKHEVIFKYIIKEEQWKI